MDQISPGLFAAAAAFRSPARAQNEVSLAGRSALTHGLSTPGALGAPMTRELLEDAGYAVVAASGPDEALAAPSRSADRPDVVVTDVILPGISGPELAERIRAIVPGVRFLDKPFGSELLLRKFREALDARAKPETSA